MSEFGHEQIIDSAPLQYGVAGGAGEKDRGKEPVREKKDFPWFWNGSEFTGDRVNDVNLSLEQKAKP